MHFSDAELSADTPPEDIPDPQKALWWLKKGDFKTGEAWAQAHAICQENEGKPNYDYIHALIHWIEGDKWNSDYWYSRVGVERQHDDSAKEWQHIADFLATPD